MKVKVYGVNRISSESGYDGRESYTFTSLNKKEVENTAYKDYKDMYDAALEMEDVDGDKDNKKTFVKDIWTGASVIQMSDSHIQYEGWEEELEV